VSGHARDLGDRRVRTRATIVLCTLYASALVATWAHVAVSAGEARWTSSRASAYSPSDSPGTLACRGEGRLTWQSLIVAHRTLPCGTRLRICTEPKVCVTSRVADRGPYVAGRDLDLAPATYRALGAASARAWGVRRVHWRALP
jgi:rare lipoprotein A (peptidoglycan hydrolase)